LPLLAEAAPTDDPEEAVPLTPPTAPAAAAAIEERLRYRGYLLAEGSKLVTDLDPLETSDLSTVEANVSATLAFHNGVQLFGDVTGTHAFYANVTTTMLNQAGLRYGTDPWQFALGKERTRKSPGLVVSPSDFLFANDALPGLREQRQGVWQLRASWQTIGQAADAIYLPNLEVDEHGLPDEDRRRRGAAWRYFRQGSAFDVAASYARIEGDGSIGGWMQAYATRSVKLYLDAARLETDQVLDRTVRDATQLLLGASYEGVRDATFRAEAYYNQKGLEGAVTVPGGAASAARLLDNILFRRRHAILSAQFTDLWREAVFTLNHIRALDYPEWALLARYEIPVGAHQALGATLGAVKNLLGVPSGTLMTLDWKYTF
jgi:hypothetical protein